CSCRGASMGPRGGGTDATALTMGPSALRGHSPARSSLTRNPLARAAPTGPTAP
ncbi:MAG: hypothetical protein AVDCRST_MAG19-1422, partial [uncultured Thermomicrobiales bacterium]